MNRLQPTAALPRDYAPAHQRPLAAVAAILLLPWGVACRACGKVSTPLDDHWREPITTPGFHYQHCNFHLAEA